MCSRMAVLKQVQLLTLEVNLIDNWEFLFIFTSSYSLDCCGSGFNPSFLLFIYKYNHGYKFTIFMHGYLCLWFFQWHIEPLETSIWFFLFGSEFASCTVHYAIGILACFSSWFHSHVFAFLEDRAMMMYLMHSESCSLVCASVWMDLCPKFVMTKMKWVNGRFWLLPTRWSISQLCNMTTWQDSFWL